MELKDFRKFVAESPIKDKLRGLKMVLNYSHLDSKIELEGIESIYKFALAQVKGWNHFENLPEYLKDCPIDQFTKFYKAPVKLPTI